MAQIDTDQEMNKGYDPDVSARIEQELEEHKKENERRAAEREEILLNKPSPFIDAMVALILKIENAFKRNKNQTTKKHKER